VIDYRPNWILRPGTHDHHVVKEVYDDNCYRVPDDMSGFCVVDIGAHIGSFSLACLARGANRIVAYEAHKDNAACAKMNLRRFFKTDDPRTPVEKNFTLHNLAVIGDARLDQPQVFVNATPETYSDFLMTGGHNTYGDSGLAVSTLHISNIADHVKKLCFSRSLLKLDCEGAEHEILASENTDWQAFDFIVGEGHSVLPLHNDLTSRMTHDGTVDTSPSALFRRISDLGFAAVDIVPCATDKNLYLFFAARRADEAFWRPRWQAVGDPRLRR